MNTFTHHVVDRAKVRLSQDGETLRIEVDRGPVDRITIEVHRPELENRLQGAVDEEAVRSDERAKILAKLRSVAGEDAITGRVEGVLGGYVRHWRAAEIANAAIDAAVDFIDADIPLQTLSYLWTDPRTGQQTLLAPGDVARVVASPQEGR